MENRKKVIAFLTDFGLSDPYVGICKGIMASINPEALVIDITHLVRPQEILQAAVFLKASIPSFPQGTIFLCVVDPGVGSDRAPLVIRHNQSLFVGPDNGIFSLSITASDRKFCFRIEKGRLDGILQKMGIETGSSSTFHARDIFAPAAALLSKGMRPEDFCSILEGPPRTIHLPTPVLDKNEIRGSIIWFDHFGNAATNITSEQLSLIGCSPKKTQIKLETKSLKKLSIPFGTTFSSVDKGAAVAYVNSFGFLEIGINGDSAKTRLGLDEETLVRVICQDELPYS